MPARRSLDGEAGAVPEIRLEGDSVTFHLDIAGTPQCVRLIIRCQRDGRVSAAIDVTDQDTNRASFKP